MNEQQIQDQLKQTIPQPTAQDKPLVPTVGDPVLGPVEHNLDEITQYKLQQHFGESYKEGDIRANQQVSYIYNSIAEQLGTNDYPIVLAKINELKRMLGLNHTNNSRYKLYQWMKLDQRRTRIELEMNNVREAV